jgi:hypothetical protein
MLRQKLPGAPGSRRKLRIRCGRVLTARPSCPDYPCGNAHGDRVIRDRAVHDGPRPDHASAANVHAGKKRDIRSNPAVVLYHNPFASSTLITNWTIHATIVVIFGMKADVLAHHYVFPYENSTSGADKMNMHRSENFYPSERPHQVSLAPPLSGQRCTLQWRRCRPTRHPAPRVRPQCFRGRGLPPARNES